MSEMFNNGVELSSYKINKGQYFYYLVIMSLKSVAAACRTLRHGILGPTILKSQKSQTFNSHLSKRAWFYPQGQGEGTQRS